MDLGKNLLQNVEECVSVPNCQDGRDSHDSGPTGGLVASVTKNVMGSYGTKGVEAHAEMLESIAPDALHGNPTNVITSSASRLPIAAIGDPAKKSLSVPSPGPSVVGAIEAIESSHANPTDKAGDAVSSAVVGVAEEVERKALSVVLDRIRTTILAHTSRLPIIGSYLKKHADEVNVETLVSETTPLLGALRDPKAFATQQADGLLRRLLSPLVHCLPDIDTLDNKEWVAYAPFFKALVELYVLATDGSGWLFTRLQEHSLVIAPTISLGHLSTTDLAASTIGTTIASVTGYSIIQGFISALDKLLATSSDHHIAKMHCARAAFVTGIVMFPITSLWTIQSTSILQRFGQGPEVAALAGEYLRIASAGLPGYAIGEIAKRYLTSQGLSSIHTRMLSVTTPVNLALNYLLVDGPIPAFRLGFVGAPLCTVLSHNMLAAMLVIYIVQGAVRDEVNYLRGRNSTDEEPVNNNSAHSSTDDLRMSSNRHDIGFFSDMGTLLFSGISGVLKSASQLWSKDFGGFAASMLGPNALATQAVLLTTATTLYQAPKAITDTSSNRIQKWIIKGDIQRAKIATFVSFLATAAGATMIGNVLLASASSWGKLFNNDPVVLENVSAILPVIAAFQAVHAIGAWVDTSLGALGKTTIFPALNASADSFLGIPLGLYLAFLRGQGLAGLWVGLTVSLTYTCFVASAVLVRINWKKAVSQKESVPRTEEAEVHAADEPSGFTSLA